MIKKESEKTDYLVIGANVSLVEKRIINAEYLKFKKKNPEFKFITTFYSRTLNKLDYGFLGAFDMVTMK